MGASSFEVEDAKVIGKFMQSSTLKLLVKHGRLNLNGLDGSYSRISYREGSKVWR